MKSIFFSSLALLGSASLAPAAIVLLDGSFESNNIGDNTFLANGSSAWTGGGTTYLVDNTTVNTYFAENAPGGGVQSMSLAGSFISQQLNDDVNGPILTSSTVTQQFDISFYAARRVNGSPSGAGTFTVLLQSFNGATWDGTNLASQTFCLTTDASSSTIDLNLGVGDWSNSAINLSLTTALHTPGRNIRLAFSGSGAGNLEAAIDNVSISAVPEPSTYGLIGAGALAGVATVRRRRKHAGPTA